jgi:hypothetical protein
LDEDHIVFILDNLLALSYKQLCSFILKIFDVVDKFCIFLVKKLSVVFVIFGFLLSPFLLIVFYLELDLEEAFKLFLSIRNQNIFDIRQVFLMGWT